MYLLMAPVYIPRKGFNSVSPPFAVIIIYIVIIVIAIAIAISIAK